MHTQVTWLCDDDITCMMCTLMKKVKGGLHLGETLAGEVDQRSSDCQGGSKVPFAETFHISESCKLSILQSFADLTRGLV